jgi:putative transposase
LGIRQDTTKKGTTVTNKYQKNTPKTSSGPGLAVPDAVTIAMGEIADDLREGLLALAVGAGLQVMGSLMEADVATACGPRGKHDPERTAVRHGRERGSVTLGGRRVGVDRPRMRAAGGGEVPVPAYDLFSRSEILGRMAMGKMLGGLSSRRYTVGLEPVGEKVERAASATSKSALVDRVRGWWPSLPHAWPRRPPPLRPQHPERPRHSPTSSGPGATRPARRRPPATSDRP